MRDQFARFVTKGRKTAYSAPSPAEHAPQKFRLAAQIIPPVFRLKVNPGPVLVADLR